MANTPLIFISYSRRNREFARDLYRRLADLGFRLWRDVHDIEAGADDWWAEIREGIEQCDTLILCMSLPALRSPIVSDEWFLARQLGKRVIPVVAEDIWEHPDVQGGAFTLPNWMNRTNWIDYRDGRPETEAAWNNLIRTLRSPYQPKRFINMVEELPPRFVRRERELDAAIRSLVDDDNDAIAMTTALRGAGGYGKTTLARAVARDLRVQGAFDDGILWVTLGEELLKRSGDDLRSLLIGKVRDLIHGLEGGTLPDINSLEMAKTRLQEAIGERYILLVVDDVWDEAHLKPFLVKGKHSSILITTRTPDTLPRDVVQHPVDRMTPPEAVELLSAGIAPDDAQTLAGDLRRLAQDLHEYPLLLALVNAQITTLMQDLRLPLADALELARATLHEQGVLGFDDSDSLERTRAFSSTIGVSLARLSPPEQERYRMLAVFPEDALMPLTTLERLWKLSKVETLQFCQKLYRKAALLHSFEGMQVRLHDVFRDYLRRQFDATMLRDLHARLVEAWDDPYALPDDYAWRFYAYHLSESGQGDRLRALLLDYRWLEAKIRFTSFQAILTDFDYLTQDDEARIIQSALHLSAQAATGNLDQLPGQLFGRLVQFSKSSNDIGQFLMGVRTSVNKPQLIPYTSALIPAAKSNLLRRTILAGENGSAILTVKPYDAHQLVTASHWGTVKFWNISSGENTLTLSPIVDYSEPMFDGMDFVPGGNIVIACCRDNQKQVDCSLFVWDLNTGKQVWDLKGHRFGYGINGLAISHDEKLAATASSDGTVIVWDLLGGKLIRRLQHHRDKVLGQGRRDVNGVIFSEDDRFVLSAGADSRICVWDLAEGSETPLELIGHSASVWSLCLISGSHYLISVSSDRTIRMWDWRAGRLVKTVNAHDSGIVAVHSSISGKYIITGSEDGTVKVWDSNIEQLLRTFEGHLATVWSVAMSLDEKRVFSAGRDGTVRIWDFNGADHDVPRQLESNDSSAVSAILVSPSGATAISFHPSVIKVWDAENGALVSFHPIRGESDWRLSISDPESLEVTFRNYVHESVRSGGGPLGSTYVNPDGLQLKYHRSSGLMIELKDQSERSSRYYTEYYLGEDKWGHRSEVQFIDTFDYHDEVSAQTRLLLGKCLGVLDGQTLVLARNYELQIYHKDKDDFLLTCLFQADALIVSCAGTCDGRKIVAGDEKGRVMFFDRVE
jgi:WD40 repeat protein